MPTLFPDLVKAQRQPLADGVCRYSQRTCAQKTGVHEETWGRWERGEHLPRIQEARLFAKAFELDFVNVVLPAVLLSHTQGQQERVG